MAQESPDQTGAFQPAFSQLPQIVPPLPSYQQRAASPSHGIAPIQPSHAYLAPLPPTQRFCEPCTLNRVKELEAQLQEEQVLYSIYSQTLQVLIDEEQHWSFNAEFDLQKEVKLLEEEHEGLRSQMASMQSELEATQRAHSELQRRIDEMEQREDEFWSDFLQHEAHAQRYTEESDQILAEIAAIDQQLAWRINVADEVFHIRSDGEFGIINSFRWGRSASKAVSWSEINAAWGEAAQLLCAVAQNVGVEGGKFQHYRLLPCGSASKIQILETGELFELYSSTDFSLGGRSSWYQRFDIAMVCFLRCLKEMEWRARRMDPKLPEFRAISDDGERIENLPIRLEGNSDAIWTKALLLVLYNLKNLLAWVSKRDSS